MKKEEKIPQIQPVENSEDTLTEVVNDNPNMDGNIEIEPGKYITAQSLLEEYHRLKDELKKKDDYIEELEAALIEIADSLYHRGEAIKEMMVHMRGYVSCHVGEALRSSKPVIISSNQQKFRGF